MSYYTSALVFQKYLASRNLGFQIFYLLKDNYLLCCISFFFSSSIDIVLMLAHVFSAFVELEYVNHNSYLFLFFLNALTEHSCEPCVCVCVCGWVGVLFPNPFVCGATRFYQHMFTELQEHARARFMKNNRYQD